MAAIFTVFFGPFQIAFQNEPGTFNNFSDMVEFLLTLIFAVDILVNFNLAFYKDEIVVFERTEIFTQYMSRMFWVDFVGVFPFETVALFMVGELGANSTKALLLSLLRLLRFVRLHRMKKLNDLLQYHPKVSLLWFTLIRNLGAVLTVTHIAACSMYFIARLESFDETTWLGPKVVDSSGFERYVTALYFTIVQFMTVGYGDYVPISNAEKICATFFMMVNLVVASWIIGSITLLVVKGDERTGEYRDGLETLDEFSRMHDFDQPFQEKLKAQLRLDFNNREIADEQVLKNFPSALRRKILRRLYLEPLTKTKLMKGVRQQFVDAFLASCTVEIFSPGEEIIERGSITSDLLLLVGGIARIDTPAFATASLHVSSASYEDSFLDADDHLSRQTLEVGDFIGEIGFFTESPQVENVSCLTVCKTLTMSRSAYQLLAQDHPGSVGKILQNLLAKVEEMQLQLPKDLTVLRAGSVYDIEEGYGSSSEVGGFVGISEETKRKKEALTSVKDLVTMHMGKQLDDQTTRLLFAASRGDNNTISLMCDQGFDPDNCDYDNRTALMVASMKGNTDVVKLLMEYKADPNLVDMHGSTALLEAVKNGHERTMDLLYKFGAKLCMPDYLAASVLCQAVKDGDILLLKRLLRVGIQVNAADYDDRTAAHIAAAEGNVAAIRVLADHGADLTLEDRWKNTVQHEAERSNARQLLEYLKGR